MPTTSVGQWVMLNCSVVTPGRTVTCTDLHTPQDQADRQTEGVASRDTCHHAPPTTTARTLAKREGYVPVKVPAAVLTGFVGRTHVGVVSVRVPAECAGLMATMTKVTA